MSVDFVVTTALVPILIYILFQSVCESCLDSINHVWTAVVY